MPTLGDRCLNLNGRSVGNKEFDRMIRIARRAQISAQALKIFSRSFMIGLCSDRTAHVLERVMESLSSSSGWMGGAMSTGRTELGAVSKSWSIDLARD